MKRKMGVLAAVLLAAILAGCTPWGSLGRMLDRYAGGMYGYENEPMPEYEDSQDSYTGGVGDVMQSCFFDFVVTQTFVTENFSGYTPAPGYELVCATIRVENTFGEDLPMGIYDFQIQWGDGDLDFGYEAEAFWNVDGCMPESYTLPADDIAVYQVIYEVPAGCTEYSISYLEYFADDTTGDVYFVFFGRDDAEIAEAPPESQFVAV